MNNNLSHEWVIASVEALFCRAPLRMSICFLASGTRFTTKTTQFTAAQLQHLTL